MLNKNELLVYFRSILAQKAQNMGIFAISHRYGWPWPSKHPSMLKMLYTTHFLSVIHNHIQKARFFHEKNWNHRTLTSVLETVSLLRLETNSMTMTRQGQRCSQTWNVGLLRIIYCVSQDLFSALWHMKHEITRTTTVE